MTDQQHPPAGDAPDQRLAPAEAWFHASGRTPFAFQRETWAAYLRGESGLVHAPTGAGKTHAVWIGPLLEALATQDLAPRALRVLWITPLRALARDTTAALADALTGLGLAGWAVEQRTGDTSYARRRKQRDKPPAALVTTPESLSLMLTEADAAERMAELRCVIIDEWHELISTKRGVQTELGLARLRKLAPQLRTWGLSATLGNLEQAMQVLLGARAPAGRMIRAALRKQTELVTIIPDSVERFPWYGHLGVRQLPAVIDAIERAATTLFFTNTRSQAEIWFQSILQARPDWLGQVALHHGSLDRDIRDRVEDLLGDGRVRCVVCTSSLDLGVDFSPVDQVIQVGSPKGIGRLLQRAGRSGHQPGALSRIVCVPTHAFELLEFAAARTAWRRGQIEAREPLRRPLDVLAQHLVTVSLGGGFVEEELLAEVRTTHAYAELNDDEWRWTLDFVTRGGPALRAYPHYRRVVQGDDGVYRIASAAMARFHRMSIGTITGETAMTVRLASGSRLGSIEESFIARLKPGDVFVFAGRVLELVRVRDMTAHVRIARNASGIVPRWAGSRFPLSTQLAAAVREKLDRWRAGLSSSSDGDAVHAEQPLTGSAADEPEFAAVAPLLKLQADWSRVPAPDELLMESTVSRDGFHVFIYPFEGRLVHEGLASLLAYRLTQLAPRSISVTGNDYGVELLSMDELPLDEPTWRQLLSTDRLIEHLLACLNSTELARRQFRDIARVAGLVFSGFPGQNKTARQIQASSELFFDVFSEFDPGNRLLDQARREVLESQLEFRRLHALLERLALQRIAHVPVERFTPLAFPLWAERLRAQQLSSEKWSDRVQKMALRLESAADAKPIRAPKPRSKPRHDDLRKPKRDVGGAALDAAAAESRPVGEPPDADHLGPALREGGDVSPRRHPRARRRHPGRPGETLPGPRARFRRPPGGAR